MLESIRNSAILWISHHSLEYSAKFREILIKIDAKFDEKRRKVAIFFSDANWQAFGLRSLDLYGRLSGCHPQRVIHAQPEPNEQMTYNVLPCPSMNAIFTPGTRAYSLELLHDLEPVPPILWKYFLSLILIT